MITNYRQCRGWQETFAVTKPYNLEIIPCAELRTVNSDRSIHILSLTQQHFSNSRQHPTLEITWLGNRFRNGTDTKLRSNIVVGTDTGTWARKHVSFASPHWASPRYANVPPKDCHLQTDMLPLGTWGCGENECAASECSLV